MSLFFSPDPEEKNGVFQWITCSCWPHCFIQSPVPSDVSWVSTLTSPSPLKWFFPLSSGISYFLTLISQALSFHCKLVTFAFDSLGIICFDSLFSTTQRYSKLLVHPLHLFWCFLSSILRSKCFSYKLWWTAWPTYRFRHQNFCTKKCETE